MRLTTLFLALLACACSPEPQTLVVKSFQLRDEKRKDGAEPLVNMEKERRLHGAVSMAERRQRLGQYHTVQWHHASGGPATVTFEYLQGNTASKRKFKRHTYPAGTTSGTSEFSVIGDDYFNNGRITAWKVTLTSGDRVIASRQSFLWE